MKTKLTTSLVAHLSRQISSGKVLWALLTLNEYVSEEKDLLLNCLRDKAIKKITSSCAYQSLQYTTDIINGKKLSEFAESAINEIRSFKEISEFKLVKKVPEFKQRTYLGSRPRSLWISRRRSYVFVNSTKLEASSGD